MSQGDILIRGGFLFPRPKDLMEFTKPLVDHELREKIIDDAYQEKMAVYLREKGLDENHLDEALEDLIDRDIYNETVLSPFFWRDLLVNLEDCYSDMLTNKYLFTLQSS